MLNERFKLLGIGEWFRKDSKKFNEPSFREFEKESQKAIRFSRVVKWSVMGTSFGWGVVAGGVIAYSADLGEFIIKSVIVGGGLVFSLQRHNDMNKAMHKKISLFKGIPIQKI